MAFYKTLIKKITKKEPRCTKTHEIFTNLKAKAVIEKNLTYRYNCLYIFYDIILLETLP